MAKQKKEELHLCYHCGDMLASSQFFKSKSGLYRGIGHLPICKNCFERQHTIYFNLYDDFRKAFQRMCIAYDVYFSDAIYEKYDEDCLLFGKYFRSLNMTQHENKSFDTSVKEGFNFSEYDKRPRGFQRTKEELLDTPEIPEDDVTKWGQGLDPLDYENLNAHYKLLKEANPNCDSNQEIFINDLCYAKMQQLKCVREGDMDNFKKMGEYYNNTFTKSGLKVVREVETNSDDCLGLWTSRISQYTPEEYYADKTLYSDHDNIKDYISRFVLRPLKNLMHNAVDRDTEFCVKEDGDEDDTEPDAE